MSLRSFRPKERIDYKFFNSTGKKVPKNFPKSCKNMGEAIDIELKIVSKLNRFLEEYDLSLLFDIKEIQDAVIEARNLIESYEDIHIQLKKELKEEYMQTYKDYDSQVSILRW